ncbi:hypothetical protein HHK36_012828 [Tetracentron sinense]|uniref:NADP-dependent oxidoreductase domain-containing protein n=1 Tax=Tetracentron sinense TaxID=13715 RepID=A0A835DFX1_TETSI|nr:hypothetical protein HHK36_012828 [Tetracentron sinense]
MALTSSLVPPLLCNNGANSRQKLMQPATFSVKRTRSLKTSIRAKQGDNPLQYRKLGDSDLQISEITLGTMTFGEQNTEKEAHEILNYAVERGINALDTAEAITHQMLLNGQQQRALSMDDC